MFGSLGITELVVILVVALVVIGPQRLPDLARSIGRALGEFRRATSSLQDSLNLDDDIDIGPDPEVEEEKTPEPETAAEGAPGGPAPGETPPAEKPVSGESGTAGETRAT